MGKDVAMMTHINKLGELRIALWTAGWPEVWTHVDELWPHPAQMAGAPRAICRVLAQHQLDGKPPRRAAPALEKLALQMWAYVRMERARQRVAHHRLIRARLDRGLAQIEAGL